MFPLHRTLRTLVQVRTRSCLLGRLFAWVEFCRAGFTQGQEVRDRIFPAVLSVDKMMSLQTPPLFPALLARVPIPHQAGDTQIFVQPRWLLILAPLQFRVIESGDVYLDVLDDERRKREWNLSDHADHFLNIGFDRWRQPLTAPVCGAVEKAFGAVPLSGSTALAAVSGGTPFCFFHSRSGGFFRAGNPVASPHSPSQSP